MDNNRGIAYPPEELIAYKALQEARISRERQGLFIPVGWLFELAIRRSPLIQSGQRIRLAKLNLVLGNNMTGKTAVTEWIAGFFAPDYLRRWQHRCQKLIDLQLTFLNPSPHVLRLQIETDGSLVYHVDGHEVPFIGMPLKIVRLGSITLGREEDDEEALSRILSLPRQIVQNLFKEIQNFPYSRVRNLHYRKDEETGLIQLHADVDGTVPGLPLRSLSGREVERVFIELATAAARVAGQHAPTVLILDCCPIIFEGFFDFYSHHFLDADNHFQTLFCIPTEDLDLESLRWNGWELIQMVGRQPDVSIHQESAVS